MKKMTLLKRQILCLMLLLVSSFSIGQILDQSNAPSSNGGYVCKVSPYDSSAGQSFVAGVTGNLSQVNIRIGNFYSEFVAGNFQLRIIAGNGYSGTVLNTTIFTISSAPVANSFQELAITLSNTVPIIAGNTYIIDIIGITGTVYTSQTNSVYANGNYYYYGVVSSGYDLWFKTFVAAGSALNFDGVNDIVSVGSNALYSNLGTGSFTLESWINPSSLSGVKSIIRKDGDYCLYVDNGILKSERFATGSGGTYSIASGTTTPISLNSWQHVAAVWTGATCSLYINGNLVSSTITSSSSSSTSALNIGRSSIFNQGFTGSIDELRIWKRALTQCEIQNNINSELSSGQTGLVVYYKFNQGIAVGTNTTVNTSTDSSGNAFTGTLTNFALTGSNSNWITPGSVITGTTSPTFNLLSVATAQTLCSGTGTTVANLTATGTAIKWYNVATGGIPLASTTTLTTGTYYVSQTTGTCEGPRTAVAVTVKTTALPTVTTTQVFNTTATVASLAATGTLLKWYDVPNGGAALSIATILYTRTYYVTQTLNSCESTRVAVAVQVNIDGAALSFDGGDDYVTCGNIMPATYTKEAWFYTSNLSFQNNIISGGSDGQHALFASPNNGQRISAGHNGTWDSVQDPTQIVANTWYHVALTYDAATTTMKLYTNGILVSTNTTVDPFIGGNALRIGAFDNGGNLFGGKIDEVRIWNRALSQAEIQNNMNCELAPGQIGLVAYYKFNQGIDNANNTTISTLTDSSGNTNTGTLTSFDLTGVTSNWVAVGSVTTGNTCSAFLNAADFEFSSKLTVYPNPSSDVFSINSDTNGTIVVYDLIGKIIKSETIDLGITKLDLSNYPSGIYLMKVTNDSNQTKTMKLIKQ
ncbi:LamG-like jellyroll fold domain-containing protein [Flavobacterium sp.]|uniref:LamG-like jellyroll fold domain-containing protein n=1 Tax=Flavobacterium sp. TaxID=239 RepID=UPI0038FC820B